MTGKDRCKILKDIRKGIAEENGIEFVTSECKHKGDCLGTCPKCESELRYLEREFEKKKSVGKKITFAGVAVGMAFSMASCSDPFAVQGDMQDEPPNTEFQGNMILETQVESTGEIAELEGDITMGEVMPILHPISELVVQTPEYIANHIRSFNREYINTEWQSYLAVKIENEDTYECEGGSIIVTYDGEYIAKVTVIDKAGNFFEYVVETDIPTDETEDKFVEETMLVDGTVVEVEGELAP